jgi:hypothetical protein
MAAPMMPMVLPGGMGRSGSVFKDGSCIVGGGLGYLSGLAGTPVV